MGETTPNIGIFIPAAGETNYDQSFAAGMVNVDGHDHTGGPNKGVLIGNAGLTPFIITYDKLNPNVVDPSTGIGTNPSLPNQLILLTLLKNIFELVAGGNDGFMSKDGILAHVRQLTGTANQIVITNPKGIAGDPVFSLATTVVNATQPSFSASASPQLNVTGSGTAYIVIFATEQFDQSNNFDGASTFTAPVDGVYLFTVDINLRDIDDPSIINARLELVTTPFTNTLFNMNPNPVTSDNFEVTINGSQIVKLSATNTVKIQVTVSGLGADTVGVKGGYFTGALLC